VVYLPQARRCWNPRKN